jgi:hypothetical protein
MSSLTPPPSKPQRGVRTTFTGLVDGFISWLCDTFYNELVALQANLNSIAAGGAYAIPFKYSTSSNDIAAGGFATLSGGSLYFDNTNSSGAAVDFLLVEGLAGSTSATKAVVKLTAQGDSSRWATWRVTSTSAGPGYKSASVQPVQSVGALVAGEVVILSISRNGDKGDVGSAANLDGPMIHVREELGAGSYSSITSGTARAFNTVKVNTIPGASLASNMVTLPAGTYTFEAFSPFASNGVAQRIALNNNTASSLIIYGAAVLIATNSNADAAIATVRGRFTLSVQSAVSIVPMLFGASNTPGGFAISSGTEVYAEAIFRKVA